MGRSLRRWPLRTFCLAACVALVSLTGCATRLGSGAQFGGSVKHLYSSEAATVNSIELRVIAANDLAHRATDSMGNMDIQQQFLPGVNPMVPATPSGALGAAIGLAIVNAIVASDRSARHSRRVSEVAEQVRILGPQIAGLDLASLLKADLEQYLTRAHGAGSFPFAIHSSATGERMQVDAVLTIAVNHAFYDWAVPRRSGVPPLPAGLLLDIRAVVSLVRTDGTLLMQDTVIFETPHSENPDEEARVAWWAEGQRYRTLMMLAGRAIAAGLTGQVLGRHLYSDESEYAAQLKRDNQRSIAERENSPAPFSTVSEDATA
jgi:hypothetical protein